jgi:hypothetical protein
MLHGIADNKRLEVLCGKFIGGAGYFRCSLPNIDIKTL